MSCIAFLRVTCTVKRFLCCAPSARHRQLGQLTHFAAPRCRPLPKIAVLDNLAVAQALAFALEAMEGIDGAYPTDSVDELVDHVVLDGIDVALVDIGLDNAAERLGVCHLRHLERHVPVLFLSRNQNVSLADAAHRCGAAGFLLKSGPLADVARAVNALATGERWFHSRSGFVSTLPHPTEREIELLTALSRGLINSAIAHELGISPRTVESHLRRMFTRYRVSSRSQLLMLAVRNGWITAHGPSDGHASFRSTDQPSS